MLAPLADNQRPNHSVDCFRRVFRVGGVSVGLNACCSDITASAEFEDFETVGSNTEIELGVRWVQNLEAQNSQAAFESGGLWRLFHDGDELVFDFATPDRGTRPFKRMRVNSSFSRGEITLSRALLGEKRPIHPLQYPAYELLMTNYLGSGIGVEVHGCGLIDSETGGHLFLGHSGAGKSTTARLWKSLRNPEVLSDDRIILRLPKDELWMYGTPWHGEAGFASPAIAKLRRIFILHHGAGNEIVPITKARAAGELLARCFPPFHSPFQLERTVEFLHRVVETVPCFEFHFIPDAAAVEAVAGFHG